MLLSLPVVLLLISRLVCSKSVITDPLGASSFTLDTNLPDLSSRNILSQLQQSIQSLGNGVQNFFGSPSRMDDTTAEQEGVSNALGRGQDPSPYSRVESDGLRHYYFPTVDFGTGVYMQTSTDLNTVLSVPSNEYKIYTYDEDVGTEAPGFLVWDSGTYVMYLSSVGSQGNAALRVLLNTGDDLLKGWTDLGEMHDNNGNLLLNYDGWAFVHPNGKRYIMYSSLYSIQIAELKNYTTIGSKIITIASGAPGQVVEAPGTFISGNTLNFFWSENTYFLPTYNTINRAVSVHSDPLDPNTWAFASNVTILASSSEAGVYGTGSAAFFAGVNGEPWLAYTVFYNPQGFNTSTNPRRVQAQPLTLVNDVIQPMIPDTPTVNV